MPDKNVTDTNVLLVEDDDNLGFVIKDSLEFHGYKVTLCGDGEAGLFLFHREKFDICILDIMMPKLDGFTMSQIIRKKDALVPIIFLTAKSLKEDKLKGFEVGGDDFITKPFSMEELMMRMQVFLKRSRYSERSSTIVQELKIGTYIFHPQNLQLKSPHSEIYLTQKEAALLELFATNQDRTIKREEILMKIWGDDDYFMGRSLDVFISRLRKYLKDDCDIQIVNYHGIGFRLLCKSRSN